MNGMATLYSGGKAKNPELNLNGEKVAGTIFSSGGGYGTAVTQKPTRFVKKEKANSGIDHHSCAAVKAVGAELDRVSPNVGEACNSSLLASGKAAGTITSFNLTEVSVRDE